LNPGAIEVLGDMSAVGSYTTSSGDGPFSPFTHSGTVIFAISPAAPTVSVGDVSVAEDAGTMVFPVSLNYGSADDVVVNFSTADGSAIAPGDYTAVTSFITLSGGATSGVISIPIIDDSEGEVNEDFNVNLTTVTNGSIGDGNATGTIQDNDDDEKPVVTVVEVNNGTLTVNILDNFQIISVAIQTLSGVTMTLDGNSVNQGDIFTPGMLTNTIDIGVSGGSAGDRIETIITDNSGNRCVWVFDFF